MSEQSDTSTRRFLFPPLIVLAVLIGCGPTATETETSSDREEKASSTSNSRTHEEKKRPVQLDRLYENVKKKYGISPDIDRWHLQEWANSSPLSLEELQGNVVVVRFWTNTCPYCAKSMPVLQNLKRKLQDQPVRFIGIYHPKPHGKDRPWSKAVNMAENWGVEFPIAHDPDWTTLKAWWLTTGRRRATSCTFVFNRRGHVTYIHPGPVYVPGNPENSKPARSYEQLTRAIQHALSREDPTSDKENEFRY